MTYQYEIHESRKRFKVCVLGRRGGKTELALNELIVKSIQSPGIYWYVAPTYRQVKQIAWRRLKFLLENDRDWKFNEQELSAFHTKTATVLQLLGADNEDSLRGVGLHGVVLDECAQMKENVWPEIIRPMLADTNGWALFIGTPKGRNWFYDIYMKANNDLNYARWHFPTSVNKYIKADELEQTKKDMSDRLYRQEILAEFLDDDSAVFKGVNKCVVGDLESPVPGKFYIAGIDLAKSLDWSVITIVDVTERKVVYFERFNEISWQEQKYRIQKAALKYNNALCIVDASGVGDPIFEDLQAGGCSCQAFKFTNESKSQLIEQLSICIEQRIITFPRIEVLVDELKTFEYSFTIGGRIMYSAPVGKHDDCVISLALAVWGAKSWLYPALSQVKQEEKMLVDRQGEGEPVHKDIETNYQGY